MPDHVLSDACWCEPEVINVGGKPKPGGKPDARLAGNNGGKTGKSQATPGRKSGGTMRRRGGGSKGSR
jgi:hypothetical protein